jgi:hypothetical protein
VPGEECVFRARAGAAPAAPVDPNAPPAPPVVSYGVDKKATGATVPPDVVDLSWPLSSVPAGTPVFSCRSGPPRAPAPPPATAAPPPAAPAANPPP